MGDKTLLALKGLKVNLNTSINVMYLAFMLLLNKSGQGNVCHSVSTDDVFNVKAAENLIWHHIFTHM